MKARLKNFIERLNFTPTERIVVLTLVGALILGLGIRLFRGVGEEAPRFDYATSDADFSARSANRTVPTTGIRPADSINPTGVARSPAVSGVPAKPLRVDLNHASKRELMALPGVGEVIAERILLYREEHGAFAAVADLLKVKGIGKKKLEHITPHCFVEN